MEKIELRVELRAGESIEKPWSAVFGLAGGTIGRGGQNKLILPDSDAAIARVHAMVRLGADAAYLANLCERRLIQVDDVVVRPGQEVTLPLGARINIGPYSIGVYTLNAASAPATLASKVSAAAPASTMSPAYAPTPSTVATPDPAPARALIIPDDFNPFEVVTRPVPKDEWGGLQEQSLTELAQQSHDGLIRALPLSGTMDDQLDNPAHSGLPKQLDPTPQLDPLALFSQSSILTGPELTEVQTGRTSELAHVFHWPKTTDRGPVSPLVAVAQTPPLLPKAYVSEESQQAVQSAGLQSVQGLDLSFFGQENGTAQGLSGLLGQPLSEQPQVAAAHVTSATPELQPSQPTIAASNELFTAPLGAPLQAFGLTLSGDQPAVQALSVLPVPPPNPLPRDRAPAIAPTTQAPPLAPSAPQCNSTSVEPLDDLASAFLEGAGLSADRAKLQLTPEFMRAFGEAFRIAIEGSIDLLAARSEIKQEFRAGVTVIGSSANNPLKFLPNADGVIMQLVGQHFPGFMKPVPAIREAYDDLRVHQLALMAGIRAAYTEALKRFDPEKMELEAPRASLLNALYDGSRKAALWDEYKKNFSKLKDSAEDELTAFSGQTFVQAYEAAAEAAKGQS